MLITKVLEKKGVIQLFGVALISSPFVNNLTKLWVLSNDPNRWTWQMYWKCMSVKPMFLQVLGVLTILNGLLMLSGRSWAWKTTLGLLGAYIFDQVIHFRENYRDSGIAVLYLIINIIAFAFIVDQLVWKVEAKSRPTPPPPPPAKNKTSKAPETLYASRKIIIHFQDVGPWGQLTAMSTLGFHVRCLLPQPPVGLETREVELKLKNGLVLKARFESEDHGNYFFKYVNLAKVDVPQLNQWMRNFARKG